MTTTTTTTTTTCVLCGASGRPRECCPAHPIFCDKHDAEHRASVHAPDGAPRSIEEALAAAVELDDTEGPE